MDNRNHSHSSGNSRGSQTRRPSAPRTASSNHYNTGSGNIDRYNYVDRDIYSNSSANRNRKKPIRRKKHTGRKIVITLVLLAFIAVGFGMVYFHVMASRLNRSGGVNSSVLAKYTQLPSGAPSWDVKNDGRVMNILLLGVDENPEDQSDGRSDTNLLLSVDSKSKTMRLVSFLRDSYLEIPKHGKDKLNTAYENGGVALTMATLENNYRVNIDKFVSTNFNNFAAIVDKMGGLDVPMTAEACAQSNANIGTHLKAGTNHLNGKQALYYARIRNAWDKFGHDDYGRTGRQRQVIELMIQKMKSMNVLQSSKIMYDYLPLVKTNLTDSDLAYLGAVVAPSLSSYKTQTQQMPAPNTFDDQQDIKGVGKVVTLDLEKNCEILRRFLYGDVSSSGN